jgi:ABC-type transporter Mla subunit MlaD
MTETRRNLVVGMFVFFGLAALGVLIVLFGQVPSWITRASTWSLPIHFAEVSGVREGTLVTLGGKTIGRVMSVEFKDRDHIEAGIVVTAAIDEEYRIPANARAETNEAIFGMGRPEIRIVVDVSSGQYLRENQEIFGRTAPAVEALFPPTIVDTLTTTATRLGEAASALKPVLEDMHAMLEPRDPAAVDRALAPGNLASAGRRLDTLLKGLNEIVGDPATRSQFKDTLANFHQLSVDGVEIGTQLRAFSGDLRGLADEIRALTQKGTATMDNIDQNVGRVARGLIDNLDRMSQILDGLAVASMNIQRGEGSLGKFVQDERLYESMVLTFERLTETIEEFKVLVKDWQKGKIRVGL